MKLRYARNLQTCQCAIFPCPALFYLLSVCWKGRFLSSVFKVSVYVFLKIRTLNLYDRVGDSIFSWIIDQLKLFSNATCYCFLFVFLNHFVLEMDWRKRLISYFSDWKHLGICLSLVFFFWERPYCFCFYFLLAIATSLNFWTPSYMKMTSLH